MITKKTIFAICILLSSCLPLTAQDIIEEIVPADASILAQLIRSSGTGTVFQLAAGIYEFDSQIRFDSGKQIIVEGNGSGLGEDATVLDFLDYSLIEADSRALSVRGELIMRNLTIRNVLGRVADLRTGNLDSPSSGTVRFENCWFIDNGTVLKSTGGRTVGTAEVPMEVNHCVFGLTPEYPFDSIGPAITLRDTTFAHFDHCDFFNYPTMIIIQLDEPETAPNPGPVVEITHSIFLGTNGMGEDINNELSARAGILTIRNSVTWDLVAEGDVGSSHPENVTVADSIVENPRYVNVAPDTVQSELDFNLQPDSPAQGLGLDGLNAGSVAAEPVTVEWWGIY